MTYIRFLLIAMVLIMFFALKARSEDAFCYDNCKSVSVTIELRLTLIKDVTSDTRDDSIVVTKSTSINSDNSKYEVITLN